MANSESVGKKIVEALKKQAEGMDEDNAFEESVVSKNSDQDVFEPIKTDNLFDDPESDVKSAGFFSDVEEDNSDPFFEDSNIVSAPAGADENFEMPANITVLKKLISQLPSGVSRHTGAHIIKQTLEALGISMKSVLQDSQQVQESLKVSARECQSSIQDYKKQIMSLEKQSQNYQKQYSALNDLISLFIQTTK